MIKASNVSKFYRRMIYAVKRKGRRMRRLINENPLAPVAIFKNQLKPIFLNYSLDKKPKVKRVGRFVANHRGEFDVKYKEIESKHKSNYYSYVDRAVQIMGNKGIKEQFRKAKENLNEAIKRQLKK
ncbi:MAG: hypothetical protein ACI9DJ_001012 [Algoriphagus sp.]|jgi:hypothetical protein